LKIEIQKPKNLKRYLQSLELRAQAFKGAVVKEAGTKLKERIGEQAQRQNQDYSKDVSLRKVQGNLHTLVIMVDEKSLSLENTQPTDVFIYEPVAKMMMSSPISGILQKNGPYPMALLPYKVDRRYFKLTFLDASC
jgi:hypothetical protein